jgi:hypothetical protein
LLEGRQKNNDCCLQLHRWLCEPQGESLVRKRRSSADCLWNSKEHWHRSQHVEQQVLSFGAEVAGVSLAAETHSLGQDTV